METTQVPQSATASQPTFKKAVRKKVKLKLAVTGPSGSGKTWSALLIAKGLGNKIALLDTENDSASLYSDRFDFDTLSMNPPYSVGRYRVGVKAAVDAGYDVLVVDSISHAWAGEGGLLAKKEAMDARGGNSYTNWATITKEHEEFKAMLLNAPIHIICTMRSKQDYILVENDKGKMVPKKVGMAPIQRDSIEYEFTTVLDMDMTHRATSNKDRTGLFSEGSFTPSEDTGKAIKAWLEIESKKPDAPQVDKPTQ